MNLPNSLTILRIILIPIFVVLLYVDVAYNYLWASIVFLLAALTDSLDGYFARKWKQITKLGIVMDPVADKLLITAALFSLVDLHIIPAWIAIVIISREFAVTGLRALKAEEGIIIAASILGKSKTISQIVAIIVLILKPMNIWFVPADAGLWLIYIALVISIISAVDYFKKFYSNL